MNQPPMAQPFGIGLTETVYKNTTASLPVIGPCEPDHDAIGLERAEGPSVYPPL